MKHIINYENLDPIKLTNPDRTVRVFVDEELTGAKNFSMGLCIIDPKSKIPYHLHEKEEEMMYIFRGKGKAIIDDKEYLLSENTAMYVPPNVKHTIINPGEDKLWFIFVYAPPGPEQRIGKDNLTQR